MCIDFVWTLSAILLHQRSGLRPQCEWQWLLWEGAAECSIAVAVHENRRCFSVEILPAIFLAGSHRLFSRLQDCSSGMWPRSAGGPVPTGRNKSKTKCQAFVLAGICWHCFKTLQAVVYFVVTYFRCTILQSGADFSSISGRAQRRRPETSEKTSHGEWLCLMILHKSVVNLPMWCETHSFQLGQWVACHFGKKCFPAILDFVARNFNLSRISLPVVGECTAQSEQCELFSSEESAFNFVLVGLVVLSIFIAINMIYLYLSWSSLARWL